MPSSKGSSSPSDDGGRARRPPAISLYRSGISCKRFHTPPPGPSLPSLLTRLTSRASLPLRAARSS
jgi:hypothetical protein